MDAPELIQFRIVPFFRTASLALILSFFVLAGVRAQGDLLVIGQTVGGNLSEGETQSWRVIALDSAMFSVIVESDRSALDPIVEIQTINGETLIRNDDFSRSSSDALIEGFTAPRSGTYRVIISGYGNSGGDYQLTLLPGYAAVAWHEEFNSSDGWTIAQSSTDGTNDSALSATNSTLNIELEGIAQSAIVAHRERRTPADFFARLQVVDVSGRNGWQVGLTLRQQSGDNYYSVILNHTGAWRMSAYVDGEERVLRDWTLHPGVSPGEPSFSLGVLARGTDFQIFYDDTLVGTVNDESHLEGGSISLFVSTANAIGSRASVSFDDLIVTVPMVADGAPIFASQLVVASSSDMMRELQRRNVVKAGGEFVLNIPESSARYTSPGVSRFTIAREIAFSDAVIAATVSWPITGQINGCGLVIRDQGNSDDYVLAFVDSTGAVGLSQREHQTFTENIFRDDLDIGTPPHHLLLIAQDTTVMLYVDGQFIGEIESTASEGLVGQAVINYATVDTICRFDNLWVWHWR